MIFCYWQLSRLHLLWRWQRMRPVHSLLPIQLGMGFFWSSASPWAVDILRIGITTFVLGYSCHITTPKQAMKDLSPAISATSHCLKGGSTGPRDDRDRDHAKFDDVKDGCLEPTVYFVDVTKTKLKSTKFRLSGNRCHSQIHFAHWHNWQRVHPSSCMCLEIQSSAPRRNRTRGSVQRSATASSVEKMDLTTWMFVLPKFGNELEAEY